MRMTMSLSNGAPVAVQLTMHANDTGGTHGKSWAS